MPAARAAGLSGERIGGEWDVCHCTKLHRAAIGGLWCYRTTAIAPRFTIRAWLRFPEVYASGYRMPRLRRLKPLMCKVSAHRVGIKPITHPFS